VTFQWTQELAVKELQAIIAEIPEVRDGGRFAPVFWALTCDAQAAERRKAGSPDSAVFAGWGAIQPTAQAVG